MGDDRAITPAIVIRVGGGDPPIPYYEAAWHEPTDDGRSKPAKLRIGRAWLELDGLDERGKPLWRKRRGRVAEGYFDERRAHAAAPQAVQRYRDRRAEKAKAPSAVDVMTFRELAHEWHRWLSEVSGASAATVQDYGFLLREAGTAAKRGRRRSDGRVMRAFGDMAIGEIGERDISAWLRSLQAAGLTPRNVNKHRQIVSAIFAYGQRADTYSLPSNPVLGTVKRREPPPARLDYYEPHEVELLASTAERGPHRATPTYKGRPVSLTDDELGIRAQQDAQDGELFRILLYTGLRLGEARALRWASVQLTPELDGGVLDVRHAVSANTEKPPKSWKPRTVPIPRPAAAAFARLAAREHFTGDDDYVFVNRLGRRLETSAIRRRYKAARDAAGLREVKLHGLRHAAGSVLAQNAGLLTARDILGHAHVSTTNRYLSGKTDQRAIAIVNAAFEARAVGGSPSSGGNDGVTGAEAPMAPASTTGQHHS